MLTELNKAEEKQEKDEIISKLNQNEVKNLILGSYFNKILSSNGFANDLEYILEFCQGGTRLPSYSKRTLLLFLEEVI
jgi:phosphosulfolactate phosphohydrolase-like enzyme